MLRKLIEGIRLLGLICFFVLIFDDASKGEIKEEFMEQNKTSEDLLKEIEKLQQEIKRMREDLDQPYYSIPKKDFETVTVKKITGEIGEQMNKKVTFWRNVFFGVFSILAFFGYTQWSGLKGRIEQGFLNKLSELGNELREKTLNEVKRETANQIEKVKTELESAQKDALNRELGEVRDDIKLAQKTALKTELTSLIGKVGSNMLSPKDAINEFNPLFQKVQEINDKELTEDFLDALFRWTFLAGFYEELDKLRVKYEKDYEFKPTTWANIAIGDMFLYEENYSPNYKKRSIEAYDKALERLPGYGTAYAVRLIIHTIDYEMQKDPDVKEREKKEALSLINIINSGSVPVSSYETYGYLDGVREGPAMGKYVDMLHQIFPEETELMSKRSEEYKNLLEKRKKLS